jgi:hypothetical protein
VAVYTAGPTRLVDTSRGAAHPSRLVIHKSMQTSTAWAPLAMASLLIPPLLIDLQSSLKIRSAHRGLEP